MQPPGELKDGSRASGWLNKLLWFCKSNQLVEGVGYRISRTTRGTSLEITDRGGRALRLRQFRLSSIQNDFYTCFEWDGSTAGTTEIYVARPFEHRLSNFNGQSIAYISDGDSFSATYSYSSPTKRTKTIGSTVETQVLIPLFKTDFHLIYAIESGAGLTAGPLNTPITDPNGDAITLLDLNLDGRAWTKLE